MSDAFFENNFSENDVPSLEILVKVININTVKCAEILERCKVLSDYSKFVEMVRTEKSAGNETFVRDAVRTAIKHGVLSEYLSRKRWEVDDMTFAEYNYDMDIAVQRREAFEDGAHDARIETARGMLAYGMPQEKVAEISGLPLSEVQQLQIGMNADL